jgi:hypothetical protein
MGKNLSEWKKYNIFVWFSNILEFNRKFNIDTFKIHIWILQDSQKYQIASLKP